MRRSATVPSSDRRSRVPVAVLACLVLAGAVLLGCDGVRDEVGLTAATQDQPAPTTAPPSTTSTTDAPQVLVAFSPAPESTGIRPDMVAVSALAAGGELAGLSVSSPDGPVDGTLTGSTFTPSKPLALAQTYTVSATVQPATGAAEVRTSTFTTTDPASTVSAEIAPGGDEVVGVGMPVIVAFSDEIDASQQASVASRLQVTSTPAVEGSWRWINDYTVHWRPRTYWPAGTQVDVTTDLAGRGFGEQWFDHSPSEHFSIGDAQVITIDLQGEQMVAYSNGQVVRTMPISGGRPAYPTAAGTNLIMEKHDKFEMDSTSVGIDGADAYNVVVDNAQRLTNSGTFIHAAPWNSQLGQANVSHGCVNASNEDAAWMMEFTRIGDPVEISNSTERVSYTNGWGDWNLTYEDWATPT